MKKDSFFEKMDNLGLALSYGDVRLKTGHSQVLPNDVSLATRFSRNIPLKIPIVSAAMDTVTESGMAIAMALAGGIGVIHRKLNPKDQAKQVKRVKFYLNGLIEKPICVYEKESVAEVVARRDEKKYNFSTFPVLNSDGKVVGVLGRIDIEMCLDKSQPVLKAMTRKVLSASPGISLDQAFQKMLAAKKKTLVLIDKGGKIAGMYTYPDVYRIKMGDSQFLNLDNGGHLRVAAAIGTGENSAERAKILVEAGVDALVIDTAHGDSEPVLKMVAYLRENFSIVDIVVGNVSEAESVEKLADLGVDGIKVGQGPGSICTTRIIAGIGCPQLTAVYKCAKAANVPVCADGGIQYSGDITIALGAGASCVMLGRLLAGAEEAPGDFILYKGVKYKVYRGMGSLSSMRESLEAMERYRQTKQDKLVPEGVDAGVPYEGPVANLLMQYLGGLRSGMGYVGAGNIAELQEKADFYRISPAGMVESHPHDIVITSDPPNYHQR